MNDIEIIYTSDTCKITNNSPYTKYIYFSVEGEIRPYSRIPSNSFLILEGHDLDRLFISLSEIVPQPFDKKWLHLPLGNYTETIDFRNIKE